MDVHVLDDARLEAAQEPEPFELLGELPTGTVVLEASAGTGKTFAIAALATRYVAEHGVPLSELLLVTFTKAATAELRDRVRRRLVEAAAHLAAVLAGDDRSSGDPLLDHLAAASDAERRRRHQRLADAVTEFDTATISTIHGFCQQVLRGIGLAADVPRDATLIEDEALLREQVTIDRMVSRFLDRPGAPPLRTVLAAAKAAVDDPDARVLPTDPPREDDVAGDDPDATARLVAQLAREVRDEVARRKRTAGLLSHQDLLTRLAAALRDPEQGDAAVAILRERYRVALIDEFQDTDPVQWDILERAFAAASARRGGTGRGVRGDTRALVLIGDPKQAIYAFRGADVRAYLRATRDAARFTLPTNWRSDGPLVAGLNHLFGGTVYGSEEIVHRDVTPAPGRETARLTGPPERCAPIALRVVTEGPGGRPPSATVARALIPDDVAAEVVRALTDTSARIDGAPVRPRDIAVLVRANDDAGIVQQALRRAQVPAVINGVGSVFASAAGTEWLDLLEALERPNSTHAARRFAVTGFGGWTARELAAADDRAWDEVHERLHTWAAILSERGVAGLLRAVATTTRLSERLLATVGGERALTDLHHVGQLLHTAQLDADLGPSALRVWLEERIEDAQDAGVPPDEQARRLESDAEAVQILTVHRSKGLEFGIVLCPYLWTGGQGARAPLTVSDPDTDRRMIDVGPSDRTGFGVAKELWTAEREAEDLRLLYVAATRARHRVVLWWVAPTRRTTSPLGTVLFSRDEHGRVRTDDPSTPPEPAATLAALDDLADACGGTVDAVPTDMPPITYEPELQDRGRLRIEPMARRIDRTWRRTSYSGLARHAADAGGRAGSTVGMAVDVAAEVAAELGTKDDEQLEDTPAGIHGAVAADDGRELSEVGLPLAAVRGSAELGTMLHAVLEHADMAAADLHNELGRHLDRQQARHRVALDQRAVLLDGLVAAVRTPLGPIADDRPLHTFTRADRLDEPRFELPLAGGDDRTNPASVALARIADLVEAHLPSDDPLAGYHERLRDPRFTVDVRGYLNGAIDLVLRVGPRPDRPDDRPDHGGGRPRYLVVDHKTNRLGWPATPTSWHYRPEGLATAMQDGHYPLQALIYSVALHRMLRWRLPEYDPNLDLGGVAYLFLRGMTGPDVPRVGGRPCGVFGWRPPTELVTDLSDLLDGRPTAEAPGR